MENPARTHAFNKQILELAEIAHGDGGVVGFLMPKSGDQFHASIVRVQAAPDHPDMVELQVFTTGKDRTQVRVLISHSEWQRLIRPHGASPPRSA